MNMAESLLLSEGSLPPPPTIHYGNEAEFKQKYKICEKIGQGASAEVYEGIRLADNLPVALKFVPNEHVLNWDKTNGKDIPIEISVLLQRLWRIPGVIKVYDCYSLDDTVIVVMQKIKNSISLKQFIKQKKKIDEDLARSFFSQMVETLILCYEAGVVHEDIQLSNVLVDLDKLKVYLIDFGDSEFISEQDFFQRREPADTLLDTAKKFYYFREISTVYDVVMILYCMVAGGGNDFPFGISAEDMVMSLSTNISMECREFLSESLCVDEEKRPTLHQILAHSWVTQASVGRRAAAFQSTK